MSSDERPSLLTSWNWNLCLVHDARPLQTRPLPPERMHQTRGSFTRLVRVPIIPRGRVTHIGAIEYRLVWRGGGDARAMRYALKCDGGARRAFKVCFAEHSQCEPINHNAPETISGCTSGGLRAAHVGRRAL